MFKGASLTDIWTAINAGVQALNNLSSSLKTSIVSGPQGIQGPAGPAGSSGVSFLRSYLAGLTLSNDGSLPNTVLDIAAGQCTDSGNTTTISLGAFTKSTGGSWVLGTGNNGMGQGLTIANTTWYHVFAGLATGGAADVYFDTDPGGANKPAAFTVIRRIGSFLTDGSAHIIAFSQNGDEFLWSTAVTDVSTTTLASASGTLLTLTSVPLGIIVNALFRADVLNAAAQTDVLITSPAESDQAVSVTTGVITVRVVVAGNRIAVGHMNIRTNTSQQIRARASAGANTTMQISTFGWIDTRGRNA